MPSHGHGIGRWRPIAFAVSLLLAHAAAAHAAIAFSQPSNGATITSFPPGGITITGTHTGAIFVFLRIVQDPTLPNPPLNDGNATTLVNAKVIDAQHWSAGPLYLLNGHYALTVSSNQDLPVQIAISVSVPTNPGFLYCGTEPNGFGAQAPAISWNPGGGVTAPSVNFNVKRSSTASDPELFASPTNYPVGTPFSCLQYTAGHIPRVLIFGAQPTIDENTGFSGWSYNGTTLWARMITVGGTLPDGTFMHSMIAGLYALYDKDPQSKGTLEKMTGTWLAANSSFSLAPKFNFGKITDLVLTLNGVSGHEAGFRGFFPKSVVKTFFGNGLPGNPCADIPNPAVLVSPPKAVITSGVVPVPFDTGSMGCLVVVEAQFQSPVYIDIPITPRPSIVTVPDGITAEATSADGAAVSFTASASEPDGTALDVSCTPASGSTFALATTAVKCSATDSFDNTVDASFNVSVVDTTPPVVTTSGDVKVEATSPGGAVAVFLASATDLVDVTDAVSCSPASGSIFPIGTTTVTCSAKDAHGNAGSATLKVTVLSPAQITLDLIGKVAIDNFQQANNLLQSALRSINGGNIGAACNQLGAFINQVQAQAGKSLTTTDAASLITSATDARGALGCR
jgi:hypothetical protein